MQGWNQKTFIISKDPKSELLKIKTDLDLDLLGHWVMFLHYPVTQPKQVEVAQINRKHILFHIIRTILMKKDLRIAFKGFLIILIKALDC